MGYIPLFLDVTRQPCIVIGGDAVAERRVRALVDAQAEVTIVSPSLTRYLTRQVRSKRVKHIRRQYEPGDIQGFKLAFVATRDAEVGAEAFREADELGIPINVADTPHLCSFITPAVVRRGGLQIAISTGGASPALARRLRLKLSESIGPEYAGLVELLAAARHYLRKHQSDSKVRRSVLNRLAASRKLRESLKLNRIADTDACLMSSMGVGIAQLDLRMKAASAGEIKIDAGCSSK